LHLLAAAISTAGQASNGTRHLSATKVRVSTFVTEMIHAQIGSWNLSGLE